MHIPQVGLTTLAVTFLTLYQMQDDIVSFRFGSCDFGSFRFRFIPVLGVSVSFPEYFRSFPFPVLSGSVSFRFRCFPFLFVSVLFRFVSFRFRCFPFRFVSFPPFRFVSHVFLKSEQRNAR